MKVQQFRAILWLHWRLRINQLKRAGTVNAVILAILAVAALVFAVFSCFVLFLVGLLALTKTPAPGLMLVWDGLVVAFLFFWGIGLITELQRSEVLRLEKFLHLPVTLSGAFLVNYLSSLLSLTLIVFVPAMIGLAFGLVFARGPAILLVLPLVAAFLLMVTAITYQFQGWLASLMVNQRRRRTIIVLVTVSFILLCQLPNLLNIVHPWKEQLGEEIQRRFPEELKDLERSRSLGEISEAEYQRRSSEIREKHKTQVEKLNQQTWQQVQEIAWICNLVLPPGWLPLGVMTAAEGEVLPSLLGIVGLTAIGSASLWRAYATTVRLYTGQFGSATRRPIPVATPPKPAHAQVELLERQLPGLSEHASAIALGTLRSLMRAPEVKMMLLTPIILVVVFGAMLVRRSTVLPDAVPPLFAFGAMSIVLFSMVSLMGNQFGLDRSGFRVFVLCPARRREILLGKNLAFAPLVLGMGLPIVCLVAIVYRMRLDYFLAAWPQAISMYLLFCLLANALSILAPMAIAAGTFKPTNFKGIHFLLHLAFLFLFPLALGPTLLPLGIQVAGESLDWVHGIPICLLLSLVECVGVCYLYRLIVKWQGDWLQARERKILEIVTTKAE